jgi:hypothetical protein
MSKIVWHETGAKIYETGVKNGVLYVMESGTYAAGVPWNGLTAVTESPSGAEATPLYADDIKYLELRSAEEFGGTIEAYTYPDEFAACDGSKSLVTGVTIGQQARSTFGFCYRTTMGNDTDKTDHGYKLHIVYGATASPSEKGYATINDNPEAITFSWEFTTTPVSFEYDNATYTTATITIDSTKVTKENLEALEALLYGTDDDDPTLPLPAVVFSTLAGTAG